MKKLLLLCILAHVSVFQTKGQVVSQGIGVIFCVVGAMALNEVWQAIPTEKPISLEFTYEHVDKECSKEFFKVSLFPSMGFEAWKSIDSFGLLKTDHIRYGIWLDTRKKNSIEKKLILSIVPAVFLLDGLKRLGS